MWKNVRYSEIMYCDLQKLVNCLLTVYNVFRVDGLEFKSSFSFIRVSKLSFQVLFDTFLSWQSRSSNSSRSSSVLKSLE